MNDLHDALTAELQALLVLHQDAPLFIVDEDDDDSALEIRSCNYGPYIHAIILKVGYKNGPR